MGRIAAEREVSAAEATKMKKEVSNIYLSLYFYGLTIGYLLVEMQ